MNQKKIFITLLVQKEITSFAMVLIETPEEGRNELLSG